MMYRLLRALKVVLLHNAIFKKRTHVNSSGLNVYRELRQEMSLLVFNENVGISFTGLNVNVLMLVNTETARFPEQMEPSTFFC